jgi:hypothetical protein
MPSNFLSPTQLGLFAPSCFVAALSFTLLACGDDDTEPNVETDAASTDAATDGSSQGATDAGADAGSDVVEDTAVVEPITCTGLFGAPNETTGLDDSQCSPVCACSDTTWEAPDYTPADFDALRALQFTGPAELLVSPTESPYQQPGGVELPPAGSVCAVLVDGEGGYSLAEYESATAAELDGAQVTHGGVCGVCSNLADLTVYLENPDLTTPVRECGLQGVRQGDEVNLQCLRDIGFSEPCAWIWLHNTINTRNECAAECFSALNDPFNNPDGTLNACLQCDEDISGPVFKVGAGRTRRNSGLATAICRPCGEVLRIVHRYGGAGN